MGARCQLGLSPTRRRRAHVPAVQWRRRSFNVPRILASSCLAIKWRADIGLADSVMADAVDSGRRHSTESPRIGGRNQVTRFCEELERNGGCQDWQVRQAEQALRLYFINFLG